MYRIDPERKRRAKWHALLNQGQRFALVDNNENIKFTCRYFDELERAKKRHPFLNLIVIAEKI
ncbi:TPA: hypothetical protein MAR07_005295 [Klebsiella pneumoniae]|uniref:hypothetical protein n=1 Tax=Klebsiella pneumoniae TaxID=573 RepID=UPI001E5159FD|nr:hypothetical protein [Klebsiella pneumoniae]MCD5937004.1 hypothetical protein [Klebsiella pneumoniae]HBS7549507.1 hypothetical protein [Klebsiella pneumoniae]HBU3718199.1 hypothetical protein [Klebsiella pneumoniae]HBX5355692.1 hypothetical protein [Klebsiella pneumoniae]HBY4307914.1 hypothetical protein [Klebsiella pneumoniae]